MIKVPSGPLDICRRLKDRGFAAYIVGGAVRDSLLGRTPVDWDIVTAAEPAEVAGLFPGSQCQEREFGRVLVDGIDVLTMRSEGVYRDGRRPSSVTFTDDLHLDLARRDFTVNALAYDPFSQEIIDPFGGREDLELRVVRVVGDAEVRFGEDHLRMLRALRFSAVLGFSLNSDMARAIRTCAPHLGLISPERIRAELDAILLSDGVKAAMENMAAWGLLTSVLPELEPAVGYFRRHHDVFSHCVLAAHYAPRDLVLRLAALFHDAGKPEKPGDDHAAAGAELARQALERLRYPQCTTRRVLPLVYHHMFKYPEGTPAGVMRRLVLRLGPGGVRDLLDLRYADRQASGRRGLGSQGERALDHLRQVVADGSAISLAQLAVDGNDVARALGLSAGPSIGRVLQVLHERVLDEPTLNDRSTLLAMIPVLFSGDRCQ